MAGGGGGINKINIGNQHAWQRKEKIKRDKLNEGPKTLNKMGTTGPPNQVKRAPTRPFKCQLFKIISVEIDHINCKLYGGVNDSGEDDGGEVIEFPIAMPHLLQQTHYKNREEPRKNMTYVYGETEYWRRTATKKPSEEELEEDPEAEETEEIQVIIPSYEVDDVIVAMTGISGGTDVILEEDPEREIVWMDMNIDGRFWGKDTNTDDVE